MHCMSLLLFYQLQPPSFNIIEENVTLLPKAREHFYENPQCKQHVAVFCTCRLPCCCFICATWTIDADNNLLSVDTPDEYNSKLFQFLLKEILDAASGFLTFDGQTLEKEGIIDPTGAETFAKEPKLANLLRKLKPVPERCH